MLKLLSRPLIASAAAAVLAVATAGCGGDSEGSSLVDPDVDPPIHSLGIEPGTRDLLLTTNRGFFRIRAGEATPIEAVVDTEHGKAKIGTFLSFRAVGRGSFLGSGHPDEPGVAQFLGLIRSDDGGRNWLQGTRYNQGDLHVIHELHGQIYAADAQLPGVIVSGDEGRSWREYEVPPQVIVDLVVDPRDPDYMLISDDREIFRTEDGGETWRAIGEARSARLAWPAQDALYRVDENGLAYSSDDRGATWDQAGSFEGEPLELEATESERLYAALSDATILESGDGGQAWETAFSP